MRKFVMFADLVPFIIEVSFAVLLYLFCLFFPLEMNIWLLIAGGAMALGPRARGKKHSPDEEDKEG